MRGGYWKVWEEGGKRRFAFDWSKTRLSLRQAELFFSRHPKEIVMAGRGWGKDHISLLKKIYWGFLQYQRRISGLDPAFADRAGLVWHLGIMAGESGNYDDNINKLNTMLPRLPGKGVGGRPMFHFDRKEQYFELFGLNQFRISMISLLGEGGQRGPGYDDALVTEVQDIAEDKYMSVVLPMCVRPSYRTSLTLVGTGKCNWFDKAVLEAKHGEGFFGDYKYFGGTCFENPKTDVLTASQILREFEKNPGRFQRERLGLPNIPITPDEKPDCPFHPGLVEACLSHDRPVVPPRPLVVMDLMYGGSDLLCRGVWNPDSAELVRVDFYTAQDLALDTKNPYPGLTKLFMETAQMFPGCTIAYDCQGQYGGAVQMHIPRHINLVPMRRTRDQKNAMVESLVDRMAILDSQGRSLGVKIPHPDNRWLDPKQKEHIVRLLKDLYAYKRVVVEIAGGRSAYYYTKGDGLGIRDDGPDMLTWSTSQLRAMNRVVPNIQKSGRAVKRGLYL